MPPEFIVLKVTLISLFYNKSLPSYLLPDSIIRLKNCLLFIHDINKTKYQL